MLGDLRDFLLRGNVMHAPREAPGAHGLFLSAEEPVIHAAVRCPIHSLELAGSGPR